MASSKKKAKGGKPAPAFKSIETLSPAAPPTKGFGGAFAPVAPRLTGGKRIAIYGQHDDVLEVTGKFIGRLADSFPSVAAEDIPLGILLTKPFHTNSGDVYTYDPRKDPAKNAEAAIYEHLGILSSNKEVREEVPDGFTPARTMHPGEVLAVLPDRVIVNREPKIPQEAVLHSPPPGYLKDNPLWPAAVTQRDGFPRPLPFVSADMGKTVRTIRYYSPDGTTGLLIGYFGYEVPAPLHHLDRYPVPKGYLPGAPCFLITETPPPPTNAPGVPSLHIVRRRLATEILKPNTTVELADDWIYLDEEDGAVIYWPPDLSRVYANPNAPRSDAAYINWPARAVSLTEFPAGATYAGTTFRVADYPDGPPLLGLLPKYGFAGFPNTIGQDENDRFVSITNLIKGALTFADVEEIRSGFVRIFHVYPSLVLKFLSIQEPVPCDGTREWRTSGEMYQGFKASDDPASGEALFKMLEALPGSLADAEIVLWDRDLALEAVGGKERIIIENWFGRRIPARLLQYTTRPQFHVQRDGSTYVNDPKGMAVWGLDVPCLLSGILFVPLAIKGRSATDGQWYKEQDPTGQLGDTIGNGFGVCYFFMPLSPDTGGTLQPGERGGLTAEQAFFRARWFFPMVCQPEGAEEDPPGTLPPADYNPFTRQYIEEGAFANAAALLDFMVSPRIEVMPELWQEPDDAEASRLEDARAKRKKKQRRANPGRYLTLRRVEVPVEVLDALNVIPGDAGHDRAPLEEGHYVKEHYRTVRYGPGGRFKRRQKIERHQVRKDLPLKPEAEAEVAARERGDDQPRYLRVVR